MSQESFSLDSIKHHLYLKSETILLYNSGHVFEDFFFAAKWAHKKQMLSNASASQTIKTLKMKHHERKSFLARNPVCKPEIPPVIEASLKSN